MMRFIAFIIIAALLVKIAGAEKLNVGVSPPRIYAGHLLPGSHFEQEVLISKSTNEDLEVAITTNSPLITFDKESNLILENDINLVVSIDIPEDAELGNYDDTVDIRIRSSDTVGITTELVFPVLIMINVTDKEWDEYSVGTIAIPDIEECSPVTFIIPVNNKGNIQSGPETIEVTVLDKFRKQEILTASAELADVPAFSREDVRVETEIMLSAEQYSADVLVIGKDGELKNETVMFDVVPAQSSFAEVWSAFFDRRGRR